jgi:hypothetical protein
LDCVGSNHPQFPFLVNMFPIQPDCPSSFILCCQQPPSHVHPINPFAWHGLPMCATDSHSPLCCPPLISIKSPTNSIPYNL